EKKVVSFLDKSFSEYALFYACLLKGVAFCPLDKTLPANRLAMIISDVQPDMIMASESYIGEENVFRQVLHVPHECIVSNGNVHVVSGEEVRDVDLET
ncbi:hypothetical protein EAY27_29130, partial [Vibrio anguillarum]